MSHLTKKGILYTIRKEKSAYFFIALPFILFVIFTLLPLLMAFINAFLNYIFIPQKGIKTIWVGLDNFREMIEDDVFWKALKVTFIWSIFYIPIGGIVIPLLLALFVKPFGKYSRVFFRSAYYLPGVISGVIVAMIWKWIFNPQYGLLNFLISFGVKGEAQINWLGNPNLALPSLLLMSLIGGGGAGMIIYLTGMDDIPKDLYESAIIDGANAWQTFRHITMPLLKPITLFLLIMTTIYSFQIFTQIYVMTQGGPNKATTTMVYLIYNEAFKSAKYGLASAEALVLFFIIIILSIIEFKLLSSDVEY